MKKRGRQHQITMLDQAWLANHIIWIVMGGCDDDESPINRAIAYLGFLSPGDFMVCTREDLNSLGSIALT